MSLFRSVPYNGAIGKQQLEWLKHELRISRRARQYVVLFSHIPLYGETNQPFMSMPWDMEEVLNVIKEDGPHVVACIGGHRHRFGYHFNDNFDTRCHHLDLPSAILADLGGESHAILEFSIESISTKNYDCVQHRALLENGHALNEKDDDLTELTKPYIMYSAEQLVYHEGKILANKNNVVTDKKDEVAIITVRGYGNMPRLIHMAKNKPHNW